MVELGTSASVLVLTGIIGNAEGDIPGPPITHVRSRLRELLPLRKSEVQAI